MTAYSKQYALDNKEYLNKRRLLCHHSKRSGVPITEYSVYESIHGLDKTIAWLRVVTQQNKINKLKIDLEVKASI
jgi:hypothetical protein